MRFPHLNSDINRIRDNDRPFPEFLLFRDGTSRAFEAQLFRRPSLNLWANRKRIHKHLAAATAAQTDETVS
jgi:hypothetical protein